MGEVRSDRPFGHLELVLSDASDLFSGNTMSQPTPSEYLVFSRGQWDQTLSRQEIQKAIDQFYLWIDRSVSEGKMKYGQRLFYEGKTIARRNSITDGPFGETR